MSKKKKSAEPQKPQVEITETNISYKEYGISGEKYEISGTTEGGGFFSRIGKQYPHNSVLFTGIPDRLLGLSLSDLEELYEILGMYLAVVRCERREDDDV